MSPPERRLAAILAASIDRYPLLMQDDDASTHDRLGNELAQLRAAIVQASGRIFSLAGDSMMAEFASATEALRCALTFQAASFRRISDEGDPIRFRIAVTSGEILVGSHHLGGASIMLAAALGRIAPAGGIALPGPLHDQLRLTVAVAADAVGQPELPELAEPVVAVAISGDACRAWAGDTRPPRKPLAGRPADPRVSLAVVPFRAAEAQAAFCQSATDDIIRSLGGLATWIAVSRTPAARIQAPIDLHRVRQTSSARYILHGSVETERNMLRLTVELNEAETGRVLWSDRFDHLLGQAAPMREDAAVRVSRAVPPILWQRELDRLALTPDDSLTAHDLALSAFSAIMQPRRATFAGAAEKLRQAERRPGPHASTHFAMVWWHLMAIGQGWSSDPAADRDGAARAAARLDRNDPAAMALVAFMASVTRGDHALATHMLDQVIDAAPCCGTAESLKALTLAWSGETREAIFHAEIADAMPVLGPDLAWREQVIALARYLGGHYVDAERWARVSAMHHPGLTENAVILTASLAVLGRLDEALEAAEQVLGIDPDFRISDWRRRSSLPDESLFSMGQRLRLAGLPA